MGKSAPSAPAAPDPVATSSAQTASNKETALYNAGLNNPTTTTPLGTSTYTIDNSDPNSPKSTQVITLSPSQQAIFDLNNQNVTQQGQIANTALQNVQNLFNTPYDLKNNVSQLPTQTDLKSNLDATRDALYRQQAQYLDPQFEQSQAQLEAQLVNQGIPRGSQAWNTAMNNEAINRQRAYQSARDSAIAGGTAAQAQESQTGLANQAQQVQLYTQQYNQPLSLYSSLISGTQPTLPQFSGVNTSQAAPTNVLGAYQNQYQGQLNNYNNQVGNQNSLLSGATNLAATLGAAAIMSDRRLKKNIKKMGSLKNGLTVYEFEYIYKSGKFMGVMADEVLEVMPQAVVQDKSGYLAVNYSMLGA